MAAQPEYLLLLLLILPLAGLFWWAWSAERRDRRALGDETLVGTLLYAPARRVRRIRAILQLAAVGLIVVALARPRWGMGEETLQRSGLQIMVLLDGSTSMAAEDVRPNRIEAAKTLIIAMLDDLQGNQIGMLMFGSTSYVQFPLTTDLAAARTLVEPIDNRALTLGGTDIAAALQDVMRSFPLGQIEGRTIILITDGGDPDPQRDSDAIAAARDAAAAGLTIYTIGAGTTDGARIPIYDSFGNRSYKQDRSGNDVVTKLNEPLLEQIASATGGQYFALKDLDLATLERALQRAAPVDLTDQTRRLALERFYLFAGLALVLIVLDTLIGRREVT